ncbi:uncharacterized protein CDAR_411271 [Caerostris darwini]|uniref:Sm domain-containing protein n=1 Tax=Caerostris darwini TaxID=1538125 RepID=A0AAV4SEW1_9ARAC|nr:uncharacterized protein CDAR_411271 [Caerostris darwini]
MSSYGSFYRSGSSRRGGYYSKQSSYRYSSSRDTSPSPQPRDENELPKQFGRIEDLSKKEDENTVLNRMKSAFTKSPLGCLLFCMDNHIKIKVWTRNFKEVRGICTGYPLAFDKHWNLIMSEVDEVYIKPRKAKTPYLLDSNTGDKMADLPPKVPKVRKEKTPEEAARLAEQAAQEAERAAKNKERKKASRRINRRSLRQIFIRGDNIVMIAASKEKTKEDSNTEGE